MTGRALTLAFYGDDLTGSTDALETIVLAGVRARLFLEVPSAAQLREHPGLEAIGIAGMTRAMRPAAMERALRPAFSAIRALKPRHVHYKVCSTFDSSPAIGSIGRAIDVGAEIFGGPFVPILGGAPALGRYCAFGHLFARMGIGAGGAVFRIDRHPSMSRHPATPATESDLRIALGRQTRRTIGLVDFLQLDGEGGEPVDAVRERLRKEKPQALLFDALTREHVLRVGEIMKAVAASNRPLFCVGPSSVEAALFRRSSGNGRAALSAGTAALGYGAPAQPQGVLVASGSGSVVSRRQIAWGLRHGFREVVRGRGAASEAVRLLKGGRSVIVHAGRSHPGPDFGWELGGLVRDILGEARPGRVVFAGGDSSSHAARALGIRSLEMIARLTPGAPLCRVEAPGSPADRCEMVFKGGQVGGDDYFGVVAGKEGRR